MNRLTVLFLTAVAPALFLGSTRLFDVSKNLDIPFDQLKAKMTDQPGESLGKAIHDLKPDASSKAEAKKAHRQAQADIKEHESES
jgi:hypothetical protein